MTIQESILHQAKSLWNVCVCVGGGALTAIYFRNKKKTYSTGLLATFISLLEVKGGGGVSQYVYQGIGL